MNLPGESVAEPTANLRHLALEILLRLAALAGDDPESADGERGGEQQPGDVRRGAGDHGRDQGAQPDAPASASAAVAKTPCTSLAMAWASASRS